MPSKHSTRYGNIVLIHVLLHEEKAETRMLDLEFIQSDATVR